jgi:putative spermidine/putrescine transport system substrate-binding protein
VKLSIGGPSQWFAQVASNPDNPPVDIILASPRDAVLEGAKGHYDIMDPAKLPNIVDIPKVFVDIAKGYGIAFDYGANAMAYHSERIENPPKSIVEFIDRTAAGEWTATLPTLAWQATPAALIWSFNDALGGTIDDITPFINAMKRMRPHLIFWTGMPSFLTQIQSGDADIGLYTDGRTWAFNKAGNPWLKFINPTEGATIDSIVAVKPKNSHPAAWEFINVMLDAKQQAGFADITYYGLTNSKIKYSDKVKDIVTRWEKGRITPSFEIAEATPGWIERWNKELGF